MCRMLPRAGGQGEALNTSPGNHIISSVLTAVTLQSYEVGRLGNTVPLYRSKTEPPRGGRADTRARKSRGGRFLAHTFQFCLHSFHSLSHEHKPHPEPSTLSLALYRSPGRGYPCHPSTDGWTGQWWSPGIPDTLPPSTFSSQKVTQ